MTFDVKRININNGVCVGLIPETPKGRAWVVLQDDDTKTRYVFDVPGDWRLELAMSLLSADGARADVKLTWPRPPAKKKAKTKKKVEKRR